MNVKRSITDLRLHGNVGKMASLDAVADEYMFVLECYIRHIIGVAIYPNGWGQRPIGRSGFHPKQIRLPPLQTQLSERWKRCCWMQACGVVKSWLSNGRHLDGSSEPSFEGTVSIQGNANVMLLGASNTPEFDWWLRISTLERNQPVYIPFYMHPYGEKLYRMAVTSKGKISSGVTLNRRDGIWSAQMCVAQKVTPRKCRGKRGVDTGMVKILTDSRGESWGSLTDKLKSCVEKDKEIQVRKQKLNACLRAKKKPTVSLVNGRTERWVRNISGRAINEMVAYLSAEPIPPVIILEKLLASEMKFKSRAGNRMLKASQLGYIGKRTRASLDLAGLSWLEVNPAHTSQECPMCGFTIRDNRRTQSVFQCLMCDYKNNADVKAAMVIEGRSGFIPNWDER